LNRIRVAFGVRMRRLVPYSLVFCLGCRVCPAPPIDGGAFGRIEADVAAAAAAPSPPVLERCSAEVPPAAPPTDLAGFWGLALAGSPSLREAAAEVEMARGRLVQAGKYPNPTFTYEHETIGSPANSTGMLCAQVNQPIVTAGKRQLDIGVAARDADVQALALLGR